MAPTPLFHVTACNCIMHPATLTGGTVVFMHRWDAGRALELIERERVTNFSGVPTMSRELLSHPDWATPRHQFARRHGRRRRGRAAGPRRQDRQGAWRTARPAPATASPRRTASSPPTAHGSTSPSRLRLGRSCRPSTTKLVDDEGNDLEPGADVVGQLCVRGPIVIKGYLNRPEATADAIRDGWFHTGDIARIDDDGFVFIVDRAKDMVLRGGENVYCSEVEAAIYQHDGVAEAAVFGMPDERLGEIVGAAIVLRPGCGARPRRSCGSSWRSGSPSTRSRRASGSSPEHLPRNANGKFVKRELQAQLLDA